GHHQAGVQPRPRAATVVREERGSPAERPLPRVDDGKVGRGRRSDDVRATVGVNRDPVNSVLPGTADQGRVGEGARGVELDDEYLLAPLERTDGARQRKIPGV